MKCQGQHDGNGGHRCNQRVQGTERNEEALDPQQGTGDQKRRRKCLGKPEPQSPRAKDVLRQQRAVADHRQREKDAKQAGQQQVPAPAHGDPAMSGDRKVGRRNRQMCPPVKCTRLHSASIYHAHTGNKEMLDQLTDRFARIIKQVRGQARLTDANTQEMLREVRLALLEADVALPVVREFVSRVREQALGQDVAGSLTPGQALVGVVHRELARLMGGELPQKERELDLATQPPAVVLLAGLQGAGKTTTTGKLGRWLTAERRKKVLAVSTDVYRPAAIAQLESVCQQAGIEFFPTPAQARPVEIALAALEHARRHLLEVVLVDTAGRTAIDEYMMDEIAQLHVALQPVETLFVVDAMQGQDAVNTAAAFGARLPLTGIIVTKLDGDARGGVALSVTQITGKPIKFAGTGEKLAGLEPFDAERMAGRVLGMGDIVALVEEVKNSLDVGAAEKLAHRIKSGARFDLNDFREQIAQMRRMGGMGGMLDKLPAHLARAAGQVDARDADRQVRRIEGILNSMTPGERSKPELVKASRKRRIATGAGVPVQEVNRMLAQFDQMSTLMKQMRKGGLSKMMRALGGMTGSINTGGGPRRH